MLRFKGKSENPIFLKSLLNQAKSLIKSKDNEIEQIPVNPQY